jgi:1,5-anhydro-D-fructose reductase (1,5-anhydro-D-mannitol-forming)
MPLGIGMVSTGRHPDRKMAPAINATAGARPVAVCSQEIEQAQTFAQKHCIPSAYDSYDAMLKDPRVDVVYVASPNFLHMEHTIKAARAGKHVLCEKPMALTTNDCLKMIEICKREGVKLGIGFHLRQHPAHKEVRRLTDEGALGITSLIQGQMSSGQIGQIFPPPRSGRMEWWNHLEMAGAGAMVAMGVHVTDTLRYVINQEITEVLAMSDGNPSSRPIEQVATLLVRFKDDTIGMIYASRRTPHPMNNLILHGSEGRIACYDTVDVVLTGRIEIQTGDIRRIENYEFDDIGLYVREVDAFCRAVVEDQEPDATGWDGLRSVQIAVAMIESAQSGQLVHLD